MEGLPKGDELWIYFFSMLFAALSWLGKVLRTAAGEEVMSNSKLAGGLIGSLLLGFTVASLLITYSDVPIVIVWTASIIAGVIGEQATYSIITGVIKSRTGVDIGINKKDEGTK